MAAPVLIAADAVGGSTQFLKDIRPGKYQAFFLKLSGTSTTSLAFTRAEVGRVEFLQGGAPFVSVDHQHMRNINRLKGGHMHYEEATAGITEHGVLVPRGYYDNNVHQVNQMDQVQCKIVYGSSFTTDVPTAAVQKVYGLIRETGKMAYNLRIHQIDKTYGTGVFREPLSQENVFAVYVIVGTAGDLRRVRVEKDLVECANVTVGGSATADVETDLQDISAAVNRPYVEVETAAFPGPAEITLAEPGEIGEFLSDDVAIEFTTAPSTTYTQTMVVFSGDFTDSKLDQTAADESAIVQRKISRKQQYGKRRPVAVLKALGQA